MPGSAVGVQKQRRLQRQASFNAFSTLMATSQGEAGRTTTAKVGRGRKKGSKNQNAHWVHPRVLKNFEWTGTNVPSNNTTVIDPDKYENYYQRSIKKNYHRCYLCGYRCSKLGKLGGNGSGHLDGDGCSKHAREKEKQCRRKKYVNVDVPQSALSIFTAAAGGSRSLRSSSSSGGGGGGGSSGGGGGGGGDLGQEESGAPSAYQLQE